MKPASPISAKRAVPPPDAPTSPVAAAEERLAAAKEATAAARALVVSIDKEIAAVAAQVEQLEAAKLAAKNDAGLFREKAHELVSAGAERERLGLIRADYERDVAAAVKAEAAATLELKQAVYTEAAELVPPLQLELLKAAAQFYAAQQRMRTLLEAQGDRLHQLGRLGGRNLFTSDEQAAIDLMRVFARAVKAVEGIGAMSHHHGGVVSIFADELRKALGFAPPAVGVNYALSMQIEDMVTGEYPSRVTRLEAQLSQVASAS